MEKPYYLEPLPKGEKVYALLREALRAAGVVGIARVVMHTKEHLAVLAPVGAALMLDTLRWHHEVRPWNELNLPPEGAQAAGLKDAELKMAGQLIGDMTETWQPERYDDRFMKAVQNLVDQPSAAGRTATVVPLEKGGEAMASNVVDLTDLLRRSLGGRRGTGAAAASVAAAATATAAPAPAPKSGPAPAAGTPKPRAKTVARTAGSPAAKAPSRKRA